MGAVTVTGWCQLRVASAIAVGGCMAVGAAESAAADWYLRRPAPF